jgi:Mrp family chromosome partitioning ATPase
MQPTVIEEVRGEPDGVMRVQAMLFAAPNSVRRVIFASARDRDRLKEFTVGFAGSLQDAGIHSELVTADKLDEFQNGSHSNDIIVFEAPALLEEPEPIAALAMRSSTAVIVARGRTTLVADVAELGRLLDLNGIGVRAVLSVRGGRWKGSERPSADGPSAADDSAEHPWPNIEGLEAATSSRNRRNAPE